MSNNEVISHHGILGQRWGIRRYQNSDGSLTPAGRRRAQKLKGDYKQLTGKKLKGKIPDEDPNSKPVRKLTDMELKDRINRLTAEKQALSLERDLSSNGKKFVRSVGKDVLAPAAINAGRQLLERLFIDKGAEALGLNKKEAKSAYQKLKEEADMSGFKKKIAENTKWMKDEAAGLHDKKNKNQNNQNNQEKPKGEKTSDSKGDTYNTFNILNISGDKKYKDYYESTKRDFTEAVYEEKTSTPVNSQLYLDNKRKGQKYLGFSD